MYFFFLITLSCTSLSLLPYPFLILSSLSPYSITPYFFPFHLIPCFIISSSSSSYCTFPYLFFLTILLLPISSFLFCYSISSYFSFLFHFPYSLSPYLFSFITLSLLPHSIYYLFSLMTSSILPLIIVRKITLNKRRGMF